MLYDTLAAAVAVWTNKPALVAETQFAIRQAVRAAHKAGNFHRDLVKLTLTGVDVIAPIGSNGLQEIDYTTYCLRLRQLAYVKDLDRDVTFTGISLLDMRDRDNYYILDTCYAVGNILCIRPARSVSRIEWCFYQRPDPDTFVVGGTVTDWLTNAHEDLIVLWAAATVLAMIGEQEIKQRVEALAKPEFADLISDNLELIGR